CFAAARTLTRAEALPITAAPFNLVATANGANVSLVWSAPVSDEPITGYIIEAGSSPGLANLASFPTGNRSTNFFASGVGAGVYYVRVRAVSASGVSAASNEAVLIVGGCGLPPNPPFGLAVALNSGGTLVLTWNAASGSPTSYILEAGSGPGLS